MALEEEFCLPYMVASLRSMRSRASYLETRQRLPGLQLSQMVERGVGRQ